MKKKVVAIVQARVGSSRLPGKVLKKINKKEAILILLKRLSKSKKIHDMIVAIPKKKKDDQLYRILIKNNYKVFRGDENNVLKRYYNCAKKFDLKNILRITGDNPLVDPKLVDKIIGIYQRKNFDYVSNIEKRTFPKGLDVEVSLVGPVGPDIQSLTATEITEQNGIATFDAVLDKDGSYMFSVEYINGRGVEFDKNLGESYLQIDIGD